jgi:hypothetical protein
MSYAAKPIPTDASEIAGNAPSEHKEACIQILQLFTSVGGIFANPVGLRIRPVDMSTEPFGKVERTKVICEITVERGLPSSSGPVLLGAYGNQLTCHFLE